MKACAFCLSLPAKNGIFAIKPKKETSQKGLLCFVAWIYMCLCVCVCVCVCKKVLQPFGVFFFFEDLVQYFRPEQPLPCYIGFLRGTWAFAGSGRGQGAVEAFTWERKICRTCPSYLQNRPRCAKWFDLQKEFALISWPQNVFLFLSAYFWTIVMRGAEHPVYMLADNIGNVSVIPDSQNFCTTLCFVRPLYSVTPCSDPQKGNKTQSLCFALAPLYWH